MPFCGTETPAPDALLAIFQTVSLRLSEKGTSNSPSEDLAAIRSTKWTEKLLLGGPLGYAGSASETFRTVSLGSSGNRSTGSTLTISAGSIYDGL
jgi:hypothetical protein